MKKNLILAGIALLFAACSDNDNEVINNNSEELVPVTIRFSGFSISQEDFPTTRVAEDAEDYTSVSAIDLVMFASDGSEAYRHTQQRNDGTTYTTFGEFSFTIPVGNYTLVAVARANYTGDAFTLTSPTAAAYTSERPRETFCLTQAVTVTSASALDLDATMNRISSWLKIVSTDGRPASATKIRTTFGKGGKSFNPTTGLATTDTGFSQTNNPSTAVGAAIEVNALPFLYTDEESMTITIEALDASDNVLATRVVNNVPFKRNRITILRGAVFTASASAAAFQLETSWLEDETVNF